MSDGNGDLCPLMFIENMLMARTARQVCRSEADVHILDAVVELVVSRRLSVRKVGSSNQLSQTSDLSN